MPASGDHPRETPLAYAEGAVGLIELHALFADRVNWRGIRQVVRERCATAMSIPQTYDTIQWVLAQLGDAHSFFSPPDRGSVAIASGSYQEEVQFPSGHLITDRIGLLTVPAFRGTQLQVERYAYALRSLIDEQQRAGTQGWIVDVTDNSGGNMLPMLSGLAPLLGPGVIGSFVFRDGQRTSWRLDETGSLWLGEDCLFHTAQEVRRAGSRAPVAILVATRTASSGEAVVVAFSGRPMSRSFGTPTRGLSTSNETLDLSDGASLAITVARFADRSGHVFGEALQPDVLLDEHVQEAASEWLTETLAT